jgi:Flp pilus assembly protein TadG
MFMMFFGAVEFSSAVAINRKVTLVARNMSDLTSQSSSVTDTDLTNFTATSKAIMTPYSGTPLNTTVSEIRRL